MNRRIIYLLLIILVFTNAGCDIINPEEGIPAYIEVNSFTVDADVSIYGSNMDAITDVWVNIDENQMGVFELPAKIPILDTGWHKVTLKPGIKKNGIAASRTIYPFYSNWEEELYLKSYESEDDIVLIEPTISYNSEAIPAMVESFESAGVKVDTSFQSTIDISTVSENGNTYAKIVMDNDSAAFECVSVDTYKLPKDGTSIYVELEYKSTGPFIFGLYIYESTALSQQPVMYINPKEEWTKIYIDIKSFILNSTDAEDFQLYLYSEYDSENDTSVIFCFDNLKLMHF